MTKKSEKPKTEIFGSFNFEKINNQLIRNPEVLTIRVCCCFKNNKNKIKNKNKEKLK